MRGLKEVLADQALMDQIEEAVRKAGWQMTRSHVEENEIEKKEGRSNFVTRYDRMNQEYLRDRFRELLPEAAFVGEEDQEHKDRLPDGFVWIVDPIDGTTNFLFDLRLSCVSAGLLSAFNSASVLSEAVPSIALVISNSAVLWFVPVKVLEPEA